MKANAQWWFELIALACHVATFIFGAFCFFYFRDYDKKIRVGRRHQAAALVVVVSLLMITLYGLYVSSDVYDFQERLGDWVQYQPTRWATYFLVSPMLAGIIALFVGAPLLRGYMIAGMAAAFSGSLLVGANISGLVPLLFGVIALIPLIILIVWIVMYSERDVDRLYWLAWGMSIACCASYWALYLIGSAVSGYIDKTLEIGLFALADILFIDVGMVVFVLTMGERVVSSLRGRYEANRKLNFREDAPLIGDE